MNPRDDDTARELQTLASPLPVPQPRATLVWTAAVDVHARESLGSGPLGERFIVPIAGGRFWGAPGYETLCGTVRAGGADRQLLRADGVKELRAEYEMETTDGAVLTVVNEVIVDERVQPERYALSRITVRAPAGPHEWLNRRLFVGTLQTLRPQRDAVLVRGYLVEA
ncbi:DUF3237 family protein [Ramlibacter rhizophilus]|uniref:DUF3237 domain-containing protein n=1 Tax=Ramlibacter rhizophilus TaxID=1781167 RepID=A0A4Z0BYV4_9BURK|nr:DUF3237 family protein [Ramlibacter rhizophilus]TFZ03478.1 DUF3237 domain-containing protein [Ramlibacter rhizophilus]